MRLYLHSVKDRRPVWMVEWRFEKRLHRIALGASEKAARAVTVHLDHLLEAQRVGLDPPSATVTWLAERCPNELADRLLKNRLITSAARVRSCSLDEHVDAFEAHLRSKARNPAYIADRISSLREAFEACGFEYYIDLVHGAEVFESWNAEAQRIIAPKSSNKYRKDRERKVLPGVRSAARRNHTASAVTQFCRWMVRYRGETTVPPIERTPFNAEENREYERFSLGERFQLLLDAADARTEIDRGMDGPTRCTLWWLASETGYRASELGRITPNMIRLDETPHEGRMLRVLLIGVRKTKAGQPAWQAVVTPGLIDRMLDLMSRSMPKQRMFPIRVKGDWTTVAALRRDLQAAGIPHVDDAGRQYDMHSLRYELGEALLMQNPANNAVKEVMRHSTIELTLKTYARSKLPHKVAALMNRPMMTDPAQRSAAG